MLNNNDKYHLHRMVGLPTGVPSSGDVPLLLRETPTPKCSYLTEAITNIQQIRKTTKKVISKLTKYKNKSEYFIDYNGTIDEILNSIYKLFSLRGDDTKYATYERNDGSLMVFRFGTHDANGNNFKSGITNISVYISYTYRSFRGISKTPYEEYEISPQVFEENPKFVVDALINAVYDAINNQEFKLDPNIAAQIDTTKTDTIEDIVNRYSSRVYKFTDGTKAYGLYVESVISCTIDSLKIQMKDRNNTAYSILVDKNNKTYIQARSGNVPLKSAKDDEKKWKEFIHCLFKYVFNQTKTENKQYNKNTNMNKKLIRLTESDLHRIVKESVQNIISEVSAAPNGFKHRFDPNKRDGDFPLEQPEWTKDPRWQGWNGEDPEWIMKQQEKYPYGGGSKQSVRVSEAQLHQIVKESVEQALSEGFFDKFRRTANARDAYKGLDGDYSYNKDKDRFYYHDKYGNKHDTGIGYGKGNVGVNWNPFKFWNSGDRQVTQNDANRVKRNLGYWDTDYKGTIDRNAKRADNKERERKEQEKWLERQRREREDYERIKREREYDKRKAKRDAEEYHSNARNWAYDGNE